MRSSAFGDGGSIPSEYTCDGDGVAPPLSCFINGVSGHILATGELVGTYQTEVD